MSRTTTLPASRLVGTMLSILFLTAGVASARDALALRVNDAIGEPGGLVAVVIRSYASQPISQGQICFRTAAFAKSGAVTGPFASFEGATVFSKRGDARSDAFMEVADGQNVVLQFSSKSASINIGDGPIAVLYFRLRHDLQPKQKFTITLDAEDTLIFDGAGEVIPIEPRSGELKIRHPASSLKAEAEGDKITPGQHAETGVETFEPIGMSAGQVGFSYNPDIMVGRPKVKLRKEHGRRKFSVQRSPGLVLINFKSPDSSYNTVPGEIISILLKTSKSVPVGTKSKVRLDPALTWFADEGGDLLPFKLKSGIIRFLKSDTGNGSDDEDSDSSSDDEDSDSGSDDEDSDSGSDDEDSDSGSDDEDSDSSSDDEDSDSGSDDDSDSSDDSDSDSDSDDDDSGSDDG